MRLLELADVLRDAGCPVVELDGWQKRGRDLARVDAVVQHCTVLYTVPPRRLAEVLRDGRPDLGGPLSQLGHANDDAGTWWVIAAGRGNHNGYGRFGNNAIGIEKFHPNVASTPYRGMASWVAGTAALHRHYGVPVPVPVTRCLGHKETDPRRKSDPAGLDMNAFRRAVARTTTTTTLTHPQEDDMTDEEHAWLGRMHHELVSEQATVRQLIAETRMDTALLRQDLAALARAVTGKGGG